MSGSSFKRWWDPVHGHARVRPAGRPSPLDQDWPCPAGLTPVDGRCLHPDSQLLQDFHENSPVDIHAVHDEVTKMLHWMDRFLPGAGVVTETINMKINSKIRMKS